MILKKYHFLVLYILFSQSSSEKCIKFFKDQKSNTNDNTTLPKRIHRFNSYTGVTEHYEAMQPKGAGLCTVDYEDDLEGKVINVAVDELSPYVKLLEDKNEVTGYVGEIWMILQKMLKFKSNFHPTSNYELMKSGDVEVILTGVFLITSVSTVYEYSTVLDENWYSLFTLSEGTLVSKWWYTRIFDEYVWIASISFIIIMTFTMLGINKLQKKFDKQIEGSEEFSFASFNLLCVLGATSGQGFQLMPQSWSLRLCSLAALYMGMLLSCGFSSTLTSYLALRSHYVPMNSLTDVLNQGTHSLCVRKNSSAYDELFRLTNKTVNPLVKKHHQSLINRNCPRMENKMELRKSMCQSGFVYIEGSNVFLREYQTIRQDKCQIVKIPGNYWSSKICFLIATRSKYRRIINSYLLRLRSSGILKYLHAKWSQRDLELKFVSNLQPVELDHVQLLIIGLVIVSVISTIICIFEIIWFNLQNEKNKFYQQ